MWSSAAASVARPSVSHWFSSQREFKFVRIVCVWTSTFHQFLFIPFHKRSSDDDDDGRVWKRAMTRRWSSLRKLVLEHILNFYIHRRIIEENYICWRVWRRNFISSLHYAPANGTVKSLFFWLAHVEWKFVSEMCVALSWARTAKEESTKWNGQQDNLLSVFQTMNDDFPIKSLLSLSLTRKEFSHRLFAFFLDRGRSQSSMIINSFIRPIHNTPKLCEITFFVSFLRFSMLLFHLHHKKNSSLNESRPILGRARSFWLNYKKSWRREEEKNVDRNRVDRGDGRRRDQNEPEEMKKWNFIVKID